jgi:hypothetical protein
MENNMYPQGIPPVSEPPIQYPPKKEMLPGAIATLILGIASLANMAFFGWIPAIIAFSQFKKGLAALESNPDRYSPTSINMANSGKKMADIGLVLGILGMIVTFLYYYWIFSQAFSHHSYDYYDYD